ncbi:prostaglandin reductase 1-like isoform X2 [Spodoptera frugiperda]|uniref:Prostaglandin reductase 1 n=1 Tax=Spodoptera frugiperda TaxID=7108 RepID=A0A9R0F4X8_SPOFR|nr:prostaglandin reductase 1-like isoform X2 [Spodoptera frugiperda]
MVRARKYVVVNEFKGWPKREDFQIEEHELPPLKDGEILVKTQWLSVDPYMRAHSSKERYDQFGYNIAVVIETKAADYPVGTKVVSHKGWCDYCILDTNKVYEDTGKIYKLPTMKGLPDSLAVGAVGMPGATAYFGFLEHCRPKPGETVVVTGAAGAVGSLVGQIAKIKGCKVIGFAGSDEKVKWLESIGFDKAINYKTADTAAALRAAAPQGVDCYYDNVGGELSSTILYQMNQYGRVVVIGFISSYNEDSKNLTKVTPLQPAILFHRLSIRGYVVWESLDKFPEAFEQITKWIQSGKIVAKEHVTEGFENLFDALIGVLRGDNIGKAVVKI